MGRDEIKSPETVLELPNKRALWGSVAALALKAASWQGVFIRVKDLHGDTLIRAGISTALASIESCHAECALKREFRHFLATGQHSVPERDLLVDCPISEVALAA
jgi:hypothetical protein